MPGAGCHGEYRLAAAPRGLIGRLCWRAAFCGAASAMFARLAAQADRFALGAQARPFLATAAPLTAAARQRLERAGPAARREPVRPRSRRAAGGGLREALEVDAERIRPLVLARRWGVPERHAIEACLEATRLGMLELRWDLLCPRCRGAKATSASLDRLPTGAHCGTCNIDYGRDFSRNVELTFRPAADASGRSRPASSACSGR